jgi:hypothetical protein
MISASAGIILKFVSLADDKARYHCEPNETYRSNSNGLTCRIGIEADPASPGMEPGQAFLRRKNVTS